ncbi:MAG: hypothetical protein MR387_06135 [Phocaeicola plebeius]|nr:hypothetical protein [Phocaeicola plebeius]
MEYKSNTNIDAGHFPALTGGGSDLIQKDRGFITPRLRVEFALHGSAIGI